MKKIYVLAPLAGLMVFGSVYWKHARLHEMRLAETKRLEAAARQEKRDQQQAAQLKAHEQATLAMAKRNQERLDKERLEDIQKQARLELEQRRNLAGEKSRRLRPQIDHLRREIETVEAAVARAEERARELQQEEEFLADYVKQAEANREAFQRLLEKLEHIERTRATANRPDGIKKAERG